MHQHPAFLGVFDGAVVANESAATTFIINSRAVEGDVDGVGGRVVVRPQERLLVGTVSNHEVHDGAGRLKGVGRKTFFSVGIHCMYKIKIIVQS